MIPQELFKGIAPNTSFWIGACFDCFLADGETIELSSSHVEESGSVQGWLSDPTSLMVSETGRMLLVRIFGKGIPGEQRIISFYARTSKNNTYKINATIPIID